MRVLFLLVGIVLLGLAAESAVAQLSDNRSTFLMAGGINVSRGLSLSSPPPRIPLKISSPLTFNFTKGPGILALEAGSLAEIALAADVVAGFQAAADLWRSMLLDNATINVTIDYASLPAGVLGLTSNEFVGVPYSAVRAALIADAHPLSKYDGTATANLQTSPVLDFITNDNDTVGSAPRYRDTDTVGAAAANNAVLDVPRANLKALNDVANLMNPHDPASDGSITFSNSFPFDFDRSDGVTGFDFVAIAAHEIGHLMGFLSGVDIVDVTSDPNGPCGPTIAGCGPVPDLNDGFRVFSVLDLYRYTQASLAEAVPAQPANGAVLDLAFGVPSAGDTPFLSIDAGVTGSTQTFATGRFNGNGQQASHWQDNLGLGLMDPTLAMGELGMITNLDRMAFDVIGWDLIPEPASSGLSAIGLLLLLSYNSRRLSKQSL